MLLELTKSVQSGIRQERQYELISNHLANADTTGFKGDILTFDQMMDAHINVDLTQGDIKSTGNALDLALTDKGFFKIQTPQGIKYTRNGNFMLNAVGNLVNQTGDLVLGDGGPINIDGTDVVVHENGDITVDGEIAGNLDIVFFNDPTLLEKDANSNFKYSGGEAGEIPPINLSVKQGALENANVQTVKEMTKMIESHRTYETLQKLMHTFDEIDSKSINDVGRAV